MGTGPHGPPTRPYGSWPSPIRVEDVVAGARTLRELWFDRDDVYWLESRPDEAGRFVVMRRTATGTVEDVTPAGMNARTMVHEYGGGSYTVHDGTVVFSNLTDARLYRQQATDAAAPEPITPEGPFRYADLRIDAARGRVLCVLEDHSGEGECRNAIVGVDLVDGSTTRLIEGFDFVSHPRLDPTGERLCWLTWSHPDMPWDSTRLWVGRVDADGSIAERRIVAGGPTEIGRPTRVGA